MKNSNYINHIAVFALVVLAVSCGTKQQNEKNATESENNKIQTVEVVTPQIQSFAAERLITGSAQPNQKIILYAMESGYVENISKDIGDLVRKGETIATLKNPDLTRQLENRKAQLAAKQAIYERLKSTYSKTPALTSLQVVENAEADYLSAKAEVNSIQDRLGFLQVKAPFSGTITKRFIDQGALVQSGLTETNPQGIIELQQLNPIRLTIPLPESDIAIIKKGTEVTATFPEIPGNSFKATVSRTAGALDEASKTMRVEIDINNAKGTIKPGMYAKVAIQINSKDDVLSLPVTAQVMFQDKAYLYAVINNKIEQIPLQKGLSNKDYFEVLNDDISEETQIIIQGKNLVKPGQIVKPILKTK